MAAQQTTINTTNFSADCPALEETYVSAQHAAYFTAHHAAESCAVCSTHFTTFFAAHHKTII